MEKLLDFFNLQFFWSNQNAVSSARIHSSLWSWQHECRIKGRGWSPAGHLYSFMMSYVVLYWKLKSFSWFYWCSVWSFTKAYYCNGRVQKLIGKTSASDQHRANLAAWSLRCESAKWFGFVSKMCDPAATLQAARGGVALHSSGHGHGAVWSGAGHGSADLGNWDVPCVYVCTVLFNSQIIVNVSL